MTELLPLRAAFTAGDEVAVETRGLEAPATLSLWRLAEQVAAAEVTPASPIASFGRLEPGGYGVESSSGARTALDVLRYPGERLRYGFVSDFSAGRATDAVADNVRRLHLNAVQFYDWMHRHAELVPPAEEFEDALGRSVSFATVKSLVAAVSGAGSLPLGYAAVYAVGAEHRAEWSDDALLQGDGVPWTLEDFLWNVDPSSERWLAHFGAQLVRAGEEAGFAGFHLDQFGAPKRAVRPDGRIVDLAAAFPKLIEHVRETLPWAFLVFNNVNDFPTWATASAPVDAVYIEVWAPHDDLDHLGGLVAKARSFAPDKPVALAAYLSAYRQESAGALAAMKLELATVFSHGGTCLLHGEERAILTDPYYVRHAELDVPGRAAAKDYYDFAVRYGDILFDSAAVDVTRTHSGGVNNEVRISGAPVSTECAPGVVWARVLESPARRVVSLVDLTEQTEVAWDRAKASSEARVGMRIAFERTGDAPRYFFAAPEGAHRAQPLAPQVEQRYDVVDVPAFSTWAIVWAEEGTG